MISIPPIHPLTSNQSDLSTHPRHETPTYSTRLVLVHLRGGNQAKHVRGVPNPKGVRLVQCLSSAAPPPQGRYARGPDERGRDFYDGQRVRVRDPDGRYLSGQVAYPARSSDKIVFVLIGEHKIPVVNDPGIIVPMQ